MMQDRTDLLKSELEKRILVLDGAMGTMLQSFGLKEADFRKGFFENHPKDLKGNNDVLCLTRPDAVQSVHEQYLEAGADIIETNTFNGNSVSQEEYLLADRVYELNFAGAKIARAAVDKYTELEPSKPRFVAGSIGPTGKTLSMSPDVNNPAFRNLTFDELAATYRMAAEGLIDGGADLLLVETIFDTLNAKAASAGISEAAESRGRKIPVMFSGTLSDASGRLLAGQNAEAFLIALSHTPNVLSFGFNCALGAEEMRPHIAELSAKCPFLVSAHPNAGLPDELGRYRQTPDRMGEIIREFALSGLLNIVGGCCGTNPGHIRAIAEAVCGIAPRKRPAIAPLLRLSGLEPLVAEKEIHFINVGERCNVAGSRKFLNLIKNNDYSAAVQIARSQVENGALVLDVNMDDALLEPKSCMKTFLLHIASEPDIARIPVMIDSSKWEVIEDGLKCVQGKCIVNSISLKEGEDAFLDKARSARRYGAAVLCMAFDEKGQADTVERRLEVCRRMYKLLTEKLAFPPEDIAFDPNVFAVATGMKEHDNYALDFIEATRRIRQEMPSCHISGGISNVSFSFRGNELVRGALHSVFLYHAIKNGLDMGIVNPGQLALYDDLEPELRAAAENVILNKSPDAAEKLLDIAAGLKDTVHLSADKTPLWRLESLEKRIEHALVKGDDSYIPQDMAEALMHYSDPVEIIEGPLMNAMRQVGALFSSGKMFLPQVVKTARVMKSAVACLMPQIESKKKDSGASTSAGTIVLATVKGDVHDIGKNIVGVVLQCNNYKVIDLGVMVPGQTIVDAAVRENADLIGLSGLITPSLEEMTAIAEELERRNLKIPVLIGGATTSLLHTALKIQPKYSAPVVYTKDASQSIPAANALLNTEKRKRFVQELEESYYRAVQESTGKKSSAPDGMLAIAEARKNGMKCDFSNGKVRSPKQPGITRFFDVEPSQLLPYVDWNGFLRAWGLKLRAPESREAEENLLQDAKSMLQELLSHHVLTVKGLVGLFPANSVPGDTIRIYADCARKKTLAELPMLRQQLRKDSSMPNYCLADFIAPEMSGVSDWIGVFALSAGYGIESLVKHFKKSGDDYSAILLQGLADRLAEAFSEFLHQTVRRDLWGYVPDELLGMEQLRAMKYRGIRPAPGYPACPDHTLKRDIFALLNASKELGITLTEHDMMNPAASVCGFYFASPESVYFNVGAIGNDQLTEYAAARKMAKTLLTKSLSVPVSC